MGLVTDAPMHQLVFGTVVVTLFLATLAFFFGPGLILRGKLVRISKALQAFSTGTPKADYAKAFQGDPRLSHLWGEYQESLHDQREFRDGQMTVIATRSTVPADAYFNGPLVIDGSLRTEFFKHVPGLFTGVGIIGTFYGLILGLGQFQVSENAATVRGSLELLMHSVGGAFVVSGGAITMAMAVTFFEKLLLASLYGLVEEIASGIDAKFTSGVGEEYLSRMVKASESSATEAKQLKNSLVSELGELLRELTGAQVAATRELQSELTKKLLEATGKQIDESKKNNEDMAEKIANSIRESLKEPLDKIANSVQSASKDQSAAATGMLQDIMVSFSQRLNELFGGQISGISDLNRQTAESIQAAVAALHTLVNNLEESSRRSSDAMAERMAMAIEKMEARQDAINNQTHAFVEQIRQLVASSQTETNTKLQETLNTLGTELGGMLAKMAKAQEAAISSAETGQNGLAKTAEGAVTTISNTVEAAMKEMSSASSVMAKSVGLLAQSTNASIEGMNKGAALLDTASRNFAGSGERVAGVVAQVATVSSKFSELAGALTSGGSAMQELLRDYRNHRDTVSQLVTELRAIVETARRDASMTADVVTRIQAATAALAQAQVQADSYLQGVSKVLGESHKSFATSIGQTLSSANHSFHEKLGTAVQLLSSSINELELTLSTAGFSKQPKR